MPNPKQRSVRLLDNGWFWGCRIMRVGAILYAIFLALLVLMSRFFGEGCWPLSPLLYLPAQVWLLPMVILVPAALVSDRRLLILLTLCLWLVGFCYAGLRVGIGSPRSNPGAPRLTVVTNNIGQANHQSILPFTNIQNPDLIALQESGSFNYRKAFPGWPATGIGEFVLISRFPITQAKYLTGPHWRNPPASMFKIDWQGRPITVFVVHIPTPRRDFYGLRGRGFLAEILRGKAPQHFARYAEAMRQRVEVARWLEQRMAEETGPVLALGDFNMPSWGFVHALFTRRLTDSFEAVGRGFGFTFPGYTRNPLSFFGPWLRLDYVFCNRDWTPLTCKTEPHRASQHRAVAAQFALKSGN